MGFFSHHFQDKRAFIAKVHFPAISVQPTVKPRFEFEMISVKGAPTQTRMLEGLQGPVWWIDVTHQLVV
jgi:hypothetical protein